MVGVPAAISGAVTLEEHAVNAKTAIIGTPKTEIRVVFRLTLLFNGNSSQNLISAMIRIMTS